MNTFSLNKVSDDLESFRRSISGWDLTFNKLSPGKLLMHTSQLGTKFNQLTQLNLSIPIEHYGFSPKDSWTFVHLKNSSSPISLNGSIIPGGSLFILQPDEAYTLISYKNFSCSYVTLSNSLFPILIPDSNKNKVQYFLSGNKVIKLSPTENGYLENKIDDLLLVNTLKKNSDLVKFTTDFEPIALYILRIIGSNESLCLGSRLNRCEINLEKAVGYIRKHIKDNMSVIDISEHINASIRTLQYVFKKHYGISPVSYIKALKFNAIYRRLKCSHPDQTLISEVANNYGFWHMGQFSQDYKRLFGETPSTTLNCFNLIGSEELSYLT